MALDFAEVLRQVRSMPTIQAGYVQAEARIRNELEAFVRTGDLDGMAELLRDWDANSATLADAIVERTPAQAPHEERAAAIQAEDDAQ